MPAFWFQKGVSPSAGIPAKIETNVDSIFKFAREHMTPVGDASNEESGDSNEESGASNTENDISNTKNDATHAESDTTNPKSNEDDETTVDNSEL